MRKVTDLKENEAIHCSTQEEWDRILALNPTNTVRSCKWRYNDYDSVYDPNYSNGFGGYDTLKYHEERSYTIYPASDFLEPKFTWGEEVEVRDSETDSWEERIFVAKNPIDREFITVNTGGAPHNWKFIRKIQKPQEMTMEELEKELGRKIKIVNN